MFGLCSALHQNKKSKASVFIPWIRKYSGFESKGVTDHPHRQSDSDFPWVGSEVSVLDAFAGSLDGSLIRDFGRDQHPQEGMSESLVRCDALIRIKFQALLQ
jgi:hypothetical protein